MRGLEVVAVDEVVELGLLLKEVLTCGLGSFELEGQMHALMSAVLLGTAGFDTLDLDAQSEPPDQ